MIFSLTSFVKAEIKVYEGIGEYYMENKSETIEYSKNQAKLFAELDVIEKTKIHIESYSKLHNSKLTKDEIISISAGIMKVKNVQYSISPYRNGLFVIKAIMTAEVDTDKIPELVEREVQHRSDKD